MRECSGGRKVEIFSGHALVRSYLQVRILISQILMSLFPGDFPLVLFPELIHSKAVGAFVIVAFLVIVLFQRHRRHFSQGDLIPSQYGSHQTGWILNKSNRVRTTDAFSRTARVLVSELSVYWHSFVFLMLFCSNSTLFLEIQLVCDRPIDGRTDRRTDGPTHPLIEMRERI